MFVCSNCSLNTIDQQTAAYRLAHMFGWEELIYNHITVRLENKDGEEKKERFLINPYTYGYNEVTASSLVTIDIDGK